MRWTLGIIGLLLGLAAAAVVFGRIDHLRQIAPGALPGWSAAITDGSGAGTGRALFEGPVVVAWRWDGLDESAPSWRIDAERDGISAEARARVPPPFDKVLFDRATGTADLADLVPPLPLGRLAGTMQLDHGEGAFDISARRLARLTGSGQILGASLGGQNIGNGTFTLDADVGGAWRLNFTVSGPALEASGTLSGLIGAARATLDVQLIPGPEIPEDWNATLPVVADRHDEGGWRLRTTFP